MTSNIKKVFGMKNKKKPDDSDEDCPSYTDPAMLHPTTEPSQRNSRGFSHPHYPPPRPCHGSAGNSPNPRRKNDGAALEQGNRKPQQNENRNSALGLVTGEPKRAPPRINIAKKNSDAEGDYCDPIDVQRKEDYIQEMKNRPKDDYSEPWDSTIKTDMANMSLKKQGNSDDDSNEYLDPYDTGKEGIMEKRMSRGIGREFGVHGKVLTAEQRKSAADVDPRIHDPSKPSSDDYDMPWEWKQKMQMSKIKGPRPAPQAQRLADSNQPPGKPSAGNDDYDEPWEKKQSYLLKTQVPSASGKPRSPVPLPRSQAQPAKNDNNLYELPWDAMGNKSNGQQEQVEVAYITPWDATMDEDSTSGQQPRRFSQPASAPRVPVTASRKFSQPVASADDYDTPWEYKNKQQFGMMGPPKPGQLHEIADDTPEINPAISLDQQSWYHGPLKRQEAEELLRNARDCSFLVRNSESSRKDFSLSMKNSENFLHLKIVRQLDGQFILGQFSKPFMDIPKVIHHYSKNKLNIRGAEHKLLKNPVNAQPEYHTIEPEEEDVAL